MSVDESAKIKEEKLLVPREVYLTAGVRVGTHIKTKFMKEFIYSIRPDGLALLDINKIDKRIRLAARLIANYEPQKVVVVSARQYGQKPVEKFCEYTRCRPIIGRFIPGTLTNPSLPDFIEADLLVITDPRADAQALSEAAQEGIPVIALCDTDSNCSFVDLIIPTNNKGRKALALIYWLLARQVLRERGEIPPDGDLPEPPEAFEAKVPSIEE
ncbi:MAG: 30S ribosomal protein S2 [Thermoprotei archaeon]|nr:MAG: 30S ribosomal protein S2 [Thermoprotei archaeon]RLF00369.1 MAG: 30S ribosomal protein S2 [Thermoprotei archaeon]